jgi:transposase
MTKGKKKQKPNRIRQQVSEDMPAINPNAAGIDVGASEMWVSVPPDRDSEAIRRYDVYTRDLCAMADWLKHCGITSVAMESTGVYWIPVFQILQKRGIEVILVNAKYAKNVAGRKSDWLDCQWLRILHTFGLLAGSFQPAADIGVLRSYLRHRQMLIQYGAAHIEHMQKALTQMNVQLANVVADVTGLTGMRIIRAILNGERNPERLASMRHWRTKNDEATIAKGLEGTYEPEHIFALKQAVELFDFYQQQISACDQQIADYLRSLESKINTEVNPIPPARAPKSNHRNSPKFDCRNEAYRISGVDLTQIPGISESAALTILSEIGIDMGPWKTEKHFASWLTLSPNHKITGGKIFQRRTRKSYNRVRDVLCVCAQTQFNSRSALGAFSRRMRSRLGPEKAIVATAHKLALLIYRLLRFGKVYTDVGQDAYESQYKERSIRNIARKAKEFGFQLVARAEA